MKKKVYCLLVFTIILTNLIGTSALAVSNNNDIHPDSPIHHINLDTTNEEKVYVQDNDSNDQSSYRVPIYEYHWKITSKSVYRRKFGSWREGPSGKGPGDLSINESNTINRNFTASISGKYPIGVGAIGSSLGVDIGKSDTYGTSYRINLKENEIKTIIFRPKINVYKVVQTKYKINMLSGKMTPIREEVAYVDVFNNWDYSWRNGY